MRLFTVVTILLLFSKTLFSQGLEDSSQSYLVKTPSRISIVAPAKVVVTHDESNNDQDFPAQKWKVAGNVLEGVNVTFTTRRAFRNNADHTLKQDAKIALSVNSNTGPATWTVTQATDQTDHANDDERATVQASSNGVGAADFDLTVTFITGEFDTIASGNYTTKIVGTVSAN